MDKEELCNELDGISELLYGLSSNAADNARQNALIVLGNHIDNLKKRITDETMG